MRLRNHWNDSGFDIGGDKLIVGIRLFELGSDPAAHLVLSKSGPDSRDGQLS
jgi:hypothetical protein